MSGLCNKKNAFTLQPHQTRLKALIPNVDRLLLFHGIGSGKTCSSISIAAGYRGICKENCRKVVVILPASLRENFKKELEGACGKQIGHDISFFDIMSYQGFVKRKPNLDNTLVIVDEVQNIISDGGFMYKIFLNAFQNMKNSKLICLSATPMFDQPTEIALLGNMLLTKAEYDRYHLPTGPKEFSLLMGSKPEILYRFFQNRVSFFAGADPKAYPVKKEHRVYCVMSPFQRNVYMKSIGHLRSNETFQRNFLIAPRQISNLVLPDGKLGKLTNVDETFDVEKYSTKFNVCVQKLKRSPGPVFVYSNFVTVSGINALATVLSKVYGFSEFPNENNKKTFGIFRTGKHEHNRRMIQTFNRPENKDGSLIKAILGSPTMKEGVTLLRVRQIHILDPYWNRSRIDQIMGRGIRFCSHADLPPDQRKVDVYHYYGVPSDKDMHKSVDLRILKLSDDKVRKINIIETVLKETALDCDTRVTPHCYVNVGPLSELIVEGKKTKPKPKPKPKPRRSPRLAKPMKFVAVKLTCPRKRRPNDDCPPDFPYQRPNKYGQPCCYKRPKKV